MSFALSSAESDSLVKLSVDRLVGAKEFRRNMSSAESGSLVKLSVDRLVVAKKFRRNMSSAESDSLVKLSVDRLVVAEEFRRNMSSAESDSLVKLSMDRLVCFYKKFEEIRREESKGRNSAPLRRIFYAVLSFSLTVLLCFLGLGFPCRIHNARFLPWACWSRACTQVIFINVYSIPFL